MGAVLGVILIMLVAGAIAYVGDRVGHQVGRKRLTLFGLRPKYTSTIVAVGTGMLIALVVTLVALVASNLVRTAFFRLGNIQARINDLQAQSLAMEKELQQTRSGILRVPKFALVANTAWTFDLAQGDAEQMPAFSRFFDSVVRAANQQLANPQVGLRAYSHTSSEPEIRNQLRRELRTIRESTQNPRALILFLPVASQNLFRGDVISFSFAGYEDRQMAKAGETLATLDVTGGTQVDVGKLVISAGETLVNRGYPFQFLSPPLINSTQVQAVNSQLPRLHGKYKLIAKTPIDLYPHSGFVPIDVALEPAH
jgi:hypothetical protein